MPLSQQHVRRPNQKRLTSFFGGGSASNPKRKKLHASEASNKSRFGTCPLCEARLPLHVLPSHASICKGKVHDEKITERQVTPEPVTATASTPTTSLPVCASKNSHTSESHGLSLQVTPQNSSAQMQSESTILKTTSVSPPNDSKTGFAQQKALKRSASPIPSTSSHALEHTRVSWNVSQPFPGLYLIENFLTQEEESRIVQFLDCEDELPFKPARFNGKHSGKRWGVHCNVRDRRVDAPEHPLPGLLQSIVFPKLKLLSRRIATLSQFVPNEANAIDYRRRQGHWLQAHVDDRKLSKEPIANLSLAGDCRMTFANQAPHRNLGQSSYRVRLPARCLQVLTGPARYDYSHGISNADLLSDRRVSITFRESPLTAFTRPELNSRRIDTVFSKASGTGT